MLFGARLDTRAPNYLLALKFPKQLVRGRPCCKLPPEFRCGILHPGIVGDNLRPLVPSKIDFLHSRLDLLVSRVVAQRDVPFPPFQALNTLVRLALLDLRRSLARVEQAAGFPPNTCIGLLAATA